MGGTSSGLTATDISIFRKLDPKTWPELPEGAKHVQEYLLRQGYYGNKPADKEAEYLGDSYDVNKPDIQTSGVSGSDSYNSEDDDTYGEDAPPQNKRPKVDPYFNREEPGPGAGAAFAAAAGAGAPHPGHNPPPPAAESQGRDTGSAQALPASRTETVTETTEEPEMNEDGGSAQGGGSHDPSFRQTRPHIDITRGEGNTLKCVITVERKCVIQSDENPWHRYNVETVTVRTKHPLLNATRTEQVKWDQWDLKIMNTGWKSLDGNSWVNFMNRRLLNFMQNNVKRMRLDTYRFSIRNIFIRDINEDTTTHHKTYTLEEDARLQVIVDHLHYIPYYSSTGFAPFGYCPHIPFVPWDFYIPLFNSEIGKNPLYYLEYHPYMELVGERGTDVFYCFERAHWKDFRIFRNPTFYRGHRWALASKHPKTNPYDNFNLGPEVAIEGANWNSGAGASRKDHPSIVDYQNNKQTTLVVSEKQVGAKNTTVFQGPNDYYNYSEKQDEHNDIYQYNDTENSLSKGKSKGNFHDGWGIRAQQYIEDGDASVGGYRQVDESLNNWKVPAPGVGTVGDTFVLNGPIWHLPQEGVSYPRGLGGGVTCPEAVPQILCRIKDQFLNDKQVRRQVCNFDVEMELALIFEEKDEFNPVIFNQLFDEYTCTPGGFDKQYTCNSTAKTAGESCSVLEFFSKDSESNNVFQGNIYYPQ